MLHRSCGAKRDRRPSFTAPKPTSARRIATTTKSTQTPQLLRDYIHESLYHPRKGYFATRAKLFSKPSDFTFKDLKDEADYHRYIRKLRRDQPYAWRTPTSVFGRLYTDAVARYILSSHMQETTRYYWAVKLQYFLIHASCRGTPLRVIEVGPGNGICATNILEFIKREQPGVFATMEYQCVEISSKFASQLRSTLAPFAKRASVLNMDFIEWKEQVKTPTYIVGLEVRIEPCADYLNMANQQLSTFVDSRQFTARSSCNHR